MLQPVPQYDAHRCQHDLMADLIDQVLDRWVSDWFKAATVFGEEHRPAPDEDSFPAFINVDWPDYVHQCSCVVPSINHGVRRGLRVKHDFRCNTDARVPTECGTPILFRVRD